MLTDADYRVILFAVAQGIKVTVTVTLVAYTLSLIFGLIIGLMRVSHNRARQ